MTDTDHSLASDTLSGRRVLVGVTGGIAAYKTCTLVSRLAQAGAEVTVAMTPSALRFVGEATFQALSGRGVFTDAWHSGEAADPQHIALADRLDLVMVAPCSMDTLARLATGRGDDAVTLILSAIDRGRCPVYLAPSMNTVMWSQPATQRNVRQLVEDGYRVLQPGEGWQACRAVGPGRMPEPEDLLKEIRSVFVGASADS